MISGSNFHCNTSVLWWIEHTPTYKDTHIYIYIPWQGDRQTYLSAKWWTPYDRFEGQTDIFYSKVTDTLWQRDKHVFRCKETDTHILLQKDTLCFFTARRQTKLFYYTNVMHAHILWQRDRQNYFTTQTQTHTFCGKETDKTILVFYYTDKHTHFAAKRRNSFTTQMQTHLYCSKETDTLSWAEGPLGVGEDG